MAHLKANAAELYMDTTPGTVLASITDEIDNATDVEIGGDSTTDDATTRASGGTTVNVPINNDGTITFEIVKKPGDARYGELRTAWSTQAAIAIAAFDQARATSGAQYATGDYYVTSFRERQPINGVIRASVTLTPAAAITYGEVA